MMAYLYAVNVCFLTIRWTIRYSSYFPEFLAETSLLSLCAFSLPMDCPSGKNWANALLNMIPLYQEHSRIDRIFVPCLIQCW